jgi:hypothetical protein
VLDEGDNTAAHDHTLNGTNKNVMIIIETKH